MISIPDIYMCKNLAGACDPIKTEKLQSLYNYIINVICIKSHKFTNVVAFF